jgi:tetratricopeptide (TPR) repeat protein
MKGGTPHVDETTLVVPLPVAPEIAQEKPVAKPPERPPMKAAIIDPELLCRSGRELADAGKLREALSSFELAAECDAQNGTYAAEVAWCRFRMQATPASTTLKMLKNAIRIDPRSGLAHLYAGKVAAVLGNRNEAGNFLNRAAMLMPRDLRIVEALKALR